MKKSLLLIGRQHQTTPLRIVLNRGEDTAVGAEIRMAHVRAFDRAIEGESDAPEVFH